MKGARNAVRWININIALRSSARVNNWMSACCFHHHHHHDYYDYDYYYITLTTSVPIQRLRILWDEIDWINSSLLFACLFRLYSSKHVDTWRRRRWRWWCGGGAADRLWSKLTAPVSLNVVSLDWPISATRRSSVDADTSVRQSSRLWQDQVWNSNSNNQNKAGCCVKRH